MNPITARPGPVAFETPPETGFQNPAALSRTVSRPPVSERPSGSTIREQEQLSERRAAVSALAAAAAANAASNAGGLGASAEEITFGASERVEQETHDEARDAREGQDVRVDALKRIDEVAYVRFASVYKSFRDVDAFMAEMSQLVRERPKG